MIINGGSRSNGGFFAKHLMRADQNERVAVVEFRGLAAENIGDAFREMRAIASGTRCSNYFYHANLNTRDDELLTPEQWQLAADRLEQELGLTDQPRFVVEHAKDGRTHRHVVWSRIDAESMTAISDSLTYPKHERVARELELLFGHEPVESVLVRDRETPRPERNPKDWESLRGSESQLDPKAIKAHVTELWRSSDSGTAFAAALEANGYILVRGDRRDFCIIDAAGDEHSLARRIAGVKAAEIRERLGDIDRETLPSVAEGRALARERLDSAGDDPAGSTMLAEAPEVGEVPDEASGSVEDAFAAVHAETLGLIPGGNEAASATTQPATGDDFDAIHAAAVAQAGADTAVAEAEEAAAPGTRWERVCAWWSNMRDHFSEWRDHLQARYEQFRSRWDQEPDAGPKNEPEPEL